MPERIDKLRAALDELEQELAALDSIDPETRAVLEEAAREIHAALAKENAHEIEQQSLTQRLKNSVESFETSHPTLSRVVGRMIDVLGQMGI